MTETSSKKIWEILESKYMNKSIENHLHLKWAIYHFQLKKGISISEYMNNYIKLLTNLANVDVVIEDENKALTLLCSLPEEEHETLVLTIINGKQSLSYNEVSSSLVYHELRRKDKNSSNSTSTEALMVRERSSNRKGKGDRGR